MMQNYLLYTFEILLVLVLPLLILFLKGNWPLRKVQPALVLIPVIWYLTYAPIHELSHAAGVVLAGGKVVTYKLIPVSGWANSLEHGSRQVEFLIVGNK
jgi:hypothetical protein